MKFTDIAYKRPDFDAILAEYQAVIDRLKAAESAAEQLECVKQHERMLSKFSTLGSYVYIKNTIDTTDEFYEKEQEFMDECSPLFEEKQQEFYLALYNSQFRAELEQALGSLMFKNIEITLKTFTPENIPLMQEESKLIMQYSKLLASAQIEFDGETVNLSQLRKHEESLDRDTRKRAFAEEAAFFKANEQELDEIYDKLVKLRTQMAKNLGYDNFVELGYYRMQRNCYDAEMVAKYREQVVRDMLPTIVKIKEKQAARNGLDKLMWYDNTCYYNEGNPTPITDFDQTMERGRQMYREMSPETAEFIDYMFDNECFDVVSKKGKANGGYCTDLPDYKLPFIFSNFNGTSGDVDVLTHEAGHAFQAYTARNMELLELAQATLEACEVHSMSMEFFCYPWHELYYGEDANRSREMHLTDSACFLSYGVIVDEFQHEVYANPDMTPDERKAVWLKLEAKYRPYLTFEGPMFGEGMWFMRQTHIYKNPFYYIDYCLAQTTALQFWAWAQKDRQAAWNAYLNLVKKAGTKTFVELVEEAGLVSPFKDGCLTDVAKAAEIALTGGGSKSLRTF